jgi:class 3 adenylate cyclase/tetratricopeptide (TPR) repeat protein
MPDSDSGQIASLNNAILALEGQRGTLGDEVVDASITALRAQISDLEMESRPPQQRKLVTLLFMDVVGSTSTIAAHLDPEDTLEIMDSSLKRLAAPVDEHGGHVTRFMGDGFKAVFGTPIAREDDPEQAVRSGLEILEISRVIAEELETERDIWGFQIRVGVNTGLVAVGGMTEAEDTVMGRTVNLAARLESAAPPGDLLISHGTYRHVRGVFDVQPQEPIMAIGFDEPVRVYLVERIKPRAFRLLTRGVEGVETHMIGREAELKYLQDAQNCVVKEGEGQVVTVVGEAGVGKSRLMYEFQSWIELQPEDLFLYQGRARQETQSQPYALLRDVFSYQFQIQDDDPPEDVCNKVEAGFGEMFASKIDGNKQAHLIGELLGFGFHSSPYLEEIRNDAQSLRDQGLKYLDEYFSKVTDLAPVIIFLEDIHWADDSSLDAINALSRRVDEHGILVLCSTRPVLFERRQYWGEGLSAHHRVDLEPLTKWESRQLVDEILKKADQVPAALRELVVSGAEGNPFYIEELIKMLIEDGVIVKGGEHWRVEPVRLAEIDVPSTLTGVLQSRLDSLPPKERLVLQQASVIGRIFWDNAVTHLHAVGAHEQDDDGINDAFVTLREKELIFRREESYFAGASEYIFKHAILRDVTYESVLKRLRREYHGIVAGWLIDHSGGRSGEYTGLIADHLELAGELERAIPYLIQAGERASRQYANAEAVRYFSRAIALTPVDDLERRYKLLSARERAYEIQGQREPQREDLVALKQIADQLGDVCKQADVATRQIIYHNRTGNFPEVLDMVEVAIQLARTAEDVNCEATLHMQWGVALWRQGKFSSARSPLEQALEMAQSAELQQVEVEGIRTLGPAFASTLTSAQGVKHFEQALEMYREGNDRRGEAYTLNNLGAYYADYKRSYSKAGTYYETALPIWREVGDRRGEGLTIYNLGVNAAEQGDYQTALDWLSESLEIRREVGDRWGERMTLAYIGKVESARGDYARVFDSYSRALNIAQEIGDRRGEIWTQGLIGNFYRDMGNYIQALSIYENILAVWDEIDQIQDRADILFNYALFLNQTGKAQAAYERCQQGLELLPGSEHPDEQWFGLTCLGHAFISLGELEEADTAFGKASSKARKWRKPLMDYESTAGSARLLLAKGDLKKALQKLEKLLAHIKANPPAPGKSCPLDGTLEPMRIYQTCYQVLKANGDSRAEMLLIQAHDVMQTRAATIPDEKLRHSYENNVPSNQEIKVEYTKMMDNRIGEGKG